MDPNVGVEHASISLKIILALGTGLLVGLERETASKDVGIRTFALIALLGLVSQVIGTYFSLGSLAGILCIIICINLRSMWVNRSLEVTTSVAMLVTFCMGILAGQGHVFTPVASSILMTMLLAWKAEISTFAHGLKLDEIRSAIVLGLLTFVIYPILPDYYVDKWDLVNPKEAWITVIVLAGISFVNYVLLKFYSTKGLYYSALLGGAVNSSAAVAELSQAIKLPGGHVLHRALPILLMTTVAMFIRNLSLLGILEPQAIPIAIMPLTGMACAAMFFIHRARQNKEEGLSPTSPLSVSSPISLRRVLKFGFLFVVLNAAGTLGERYLGSFGVLTVSVLGGFISSASATAAVAKLAAQGKIGPTIAGIATVLTSITSAFVNLPLVYQSTKNRALTRNLGLTTFVCILSGLALMAFVAWLEHWQ